MEHHQRDSISLLREQRCEMDVVFDAIIIFDCGLEVRERIEPPFSLGPMI
jgi:hypothetical protein